jgi:hypothetical protein
VLSGRNSCARASVKRCGSSANSAMIRALRMTPRPGWLAQMSAPGFRQNGRPPPCRVPRSACSAHRSAELTRTRWRRRRLEPAAADAAAACAARSGPAWSSPPDHGGALGPAPRRSSPATSLRPHDQVSERMGLKRFVRALSGSLSRMWRDWVVTDRWTDAPPSESTASSAGNTWHP